MAQIDVNTAIKIARVVAYCPEERLPMIIDVFNHADVDIDGLEEFMELKIAPKLAALVNIESFVDEIKQIGQVRKGKIVVPVKAFNDFCRERNISPRIARQSLYNEGYIKAVKEKNKLVYSIPLSDNGRVMRYVVFR